MDVRNIKLVIEYDGTHYHGWQSQINATAVQDVMEDALRKLTGKEVRLIGAGRTDAGVHALGQVANFRTDATIPPDRYAYALNSLLPDDIAVKASGEVSAGFHARFDARGKTYRYLAYNAPQPSALLRHRALHVPFPLDVDRMREAASWLVGKHDFSAFCAAGSSVQSNERTITAVRLDRTDDLVCFEIEGDGFLYNMVRINMGTLLDVGRGELLPRDIPAIIDGRDRAAAGKTAAAHGLYLVKVWYEEMR